MTSDRATRVARAAAAGVVATLPMTLVMVALHRRLPTREQYPLPPRLITDEITTEVDRATGLVPPLPEGARVAATLVAHFAYGGVTGAPYGLAPAASSAPASALRGAGYGLGVWTASYLGWLPALGIMPPATSQPARRSGLMIAAHLVWGSTLAVLTDLPDSASSRRTRMRGPRLAALAR